MIKKAASTGALVLLIAFLLSACSSTGETLSEPTSSSSGAAVPGEKMSDDQRYTPGAMGAGNVSW